MESLHVAETVGVGWVVDRVEVVLVDDWWEFHHYQISFQIRYRGPSDGVPLWYSYRSNGMAYTRTY